MARTTIRCPLYERMHLSRVTGSMPGIDSASLFEATSKYRGVGPWIRSHEFTMTLMLNEADVDAPAVIKGDVGKVSLVYFPA